MANRINEVISFAVVALIISAVAELITSRLLFKVGIPLPKLVASPQADALVSSLGSLVFQLASVMAVTVLALSAYWLLRNSGVKHLFFATLLFFLILLAVVQQHSQSDTVARFAYSVVFTMTILSILLLFAPISSLAGKFLAVLLGGAYLTSYLTISPTILQLLPFDFQPSFSADVFQVGEFLAIANAVLIYVVFRKEIPAITWRSIFVPSFLAGLFATAYMLNPWAVSTLTMLTLGFGLFLPFPLYAASLWLYFFVVVGLVRERKYVTYGLILILLGGRNLQPTYLGLLAVVGLFLMFLPRQRIAAEVYSPTG